MHEELGQSTEANKLTKRDGSTRNSFYTDVVSNKGGPDYKSYDQQVSSLPTALQPKLHCIYEEHTPDNGNGSRDKSKEDQAFYLFAQYKGLRVVGSMGEQYNHGQLGLYWLFWPKGP